MSGHCCSHETVFDGASTAFRRALLAVIAINAALFLVEMTAGQLAGSKALQADALDFAGDTATYAISLLVIGKPLLWRARAALLKGLSLGAMGLWVLATTVWQVLILGVPSAGVMSAVGFLALAANVASVLILMKWRDGDANVRSVWLCSRNDAIGNVAVIAAAGLVFATGTAWPDLAVAALMAGLFLSSALQIIRRSIAEMAESRASADTPHTHVHNHLAAGPDGPV